MTLLGTVDASGVVRFECEDVRLCRAFLRSQGLRQVGCQPWEKPGWLGLINYWRGRWHAAAWETAE